MSPNFINVGCYVNGHRPATKKALKDAVKNGENVCFDSTSPFTNTGFVDSEDVTESIVLVVVGPDPYTKRSWYANVTRRNGKVVVS